MEPARETSRDILYQMSNIEIAYEHFLHEGFTPAQAAGIVGNLIQESNVDPESIQSGGPGRGIAQWSEGGRWIPSLMTGNPKVDLQAQLNYIDQELQSNPGYGLAALKKAQTPVQAAQIFGSDYERYGIIGARLKYAKDVANDASTGNWPQSTSGSLTSTGSSGSGSQSAQLTSAGGDIWGAIKSAMGLGFVPGVSDVGHIVEEVGAFLGYSTTERPQAIQGNTFLSSVDEMLNPSVTLLDPWKIVTMVLARGGIALIGLVFIGVGLGIIVGSTKVGREALMEAGKAAVMA